MGNDNNLLLQVGKAFTGSSSPQPHRNSTTTTTATFKENMSESCGSNTFPNAEEKTKKRSREEVKEVEVANSTTERPFKMTEPFHSQEIEKLYWEYPYRSDTQVLDTHVLDTQVLDTQDTQVLDTQDTQVLDTQDTQFEVFSMSNVERVIEDIDLNNPHIAPILQLAAKVGYQMTKVNITHWEAKGVVSEMNKVKEGDIELNEAEVCGVLTYFSYQFKKYCRVMRHGVPGLTFDAKVGTFVEGKNNFENRINISCFMADYKLVILHFHLLKCIYVDIYEKHCQCLRRKKKNLGSKLLMGSIGRTSSSGNRMSTSYDTFKSVGKPKVSFKSTMSWYFNCPPNLEPLAKRINTTFALKRGNEIEVFSQLLKLFENDSNLLDKFMNYDEIRFRDEMIRLKRINIV